MLPNYKLLSYFQERTVQKKAQLGSPEPDLSTGMRMCVHNTHTHVQHHQKGFSVRLGPEIQNVLCVRVRVESTSSKLGHVNM